MDLSTQHKRTATPTVFDQYAWCLIPVEGKSDKVFTESWNKLYFGLFCPGSVVLFQGKTRQQEAGMKQQQTSDAASF